MLHDFFFTVKALQKVFFQIFHSPSKIKWCTPYETIFRQNARDAGLSRLRKDRVLVCNREEFGVVLKIYSMESQLMSRGVATICTLGDRKGKRWNEMKMSFCCERSEQRYIPANIKICLGDT